ncbi:hypothetical protein GOBAR_AA26113 [Gossypium barbadense]|uniref:Uncharacterized protein n=1 Tax=Gossypium barbadense TaxID=3634 RepID=A0A2P5WTZ2_GOSBA|nr:hypothetical protein GOBAR_AA26113 [Gossypium barbadense]
MPQSTPKLRDHRSPRGATQSDPLNQKKLGTRIADLESQLKQAQEELKNLKDRLASAEAAKKEAQQELENKTKKPKARETVEVNEKIKLEDQAAGISPDEVHAAVKKMIKLLYYYRIKLKDVQFRINGSSKMYVAFWYPVDGNRWSVPGARPAPSLVACKLAVLWLLPLGSCKDSLDIKAV